MRRLALALLLASAVVACAAADATSPNGPRATRDCGTRDCGPPVIDSVVAGFSECSPSQLCVVFAYGQNLSGGVLLADGVDQSAWNGEGSLVFVEPPGFGPLSITVVTFDGISNAVQYR